jgi:hypothetical protein
MAELVRTKVALITYPGGETSLFFHVLSSFGPKGQGKGELRKLVGEQFDLPPDSTELLLRPIVEPEPPNAKRRKKGSEAQWTSLP